jgi:hypothetical protein
MGWWRDLWSPPDRCRHCSGGERLDLDEVLSDIQADGAATRLSVNTAIRKIDQLSKDVQIMADREQQAWADFATKIEVIKQGWAAKDAEIANLRAQLANAGADTANQVQAALDADSAVDATKVEAANVVLDELVVPPAQPEPQPEPEPVDEASAPAEGDEQPPAA